MDYKVIISAQAETDISNIYSHILNGFKSRINADAVLNRLYSEIEDNDELAGIASVAQVTYGKRDLDAILRK